MKTISAKELRNNLDSILERVNAGEEIIVKHRFRDPVVLSALPANKKPQASGRLPGLAAFEAAPKNNHTFDTTKSVKKLYHDILDEKYGL